MIVRLPQLAVLAKILCLLMVVMCGAIPVMVRSVSLYSPCSGANVTVIDRTLKTAVKDATNAPYQLLTTQSEDFSGKLYIYAEKSQKYICFGKRWKPIAVPKEKKNEMCQFYETYNGAFFRYKSAANVNHMLGFNKKGNPIRDQRGRAECFNFLKFNTKNEDRLGRHNDWVAGKGDTSRGKKSSNTGRRAISGAPRHTSRNGPARQKAAHHTKKHEQPPVTSHNQHAVKKNSLEEEEVSRDSLSDSHRHRHSNHPKQPHEDVTHPRRRFFEANDY